MSRIAGFLVTVLAVTLGCVLGLAVMTAFDVVLESVSLAQSPGDPFDEASYKSITQPPGHAETLVIGGTDHELDWLPRGLRNGSDAAVNVKVRMKSGADFIYRNVQPGATEPGRFDKVYGDADTTATDIDLLGD